MRLRLAIPLLLSSLAVPAHGDTASNCSLAATTQPRCEAQHAREFVAARNTEINASIAAVAAVRAQLAASTTHCTINATTPRCEAERARELALSRTYCKTPEFATPRCAAETAREFAAARNAEIIASITKVQQVRALASARTHCKTPEFATPRCAAEQAREFAAARNAEIDASIAAFKAERARIFAAARNAEINASIAAVKAERERSFAAARNAEINASLATVAAVRQFAADAQCRDQCLDRRRQGRPRAVVCSRPQCRGQCRIHRLQGAARFARRDCAQTDRAADVAGAVGNRRDLDPRHAGTARAALAARHFERRRLPRGGPAHEPAAV